MNEIAESFDRYFERMRGGVPELLTGLTILVVCMLAGILVSRILGGVIRRTQLSRKKEQIILRLVRWAFYALGITIGLDVMGLTKAASGIMAAGGILTIVLGFAFREIGENLLAGFLLSFDRSFDVGDLVESAGIRGTVRQINIRDVHVRTGDGIDIFVPSAIIFKNPLYNFTRDGLRRAGFVIGIDYRNDSVEARELILTVISGIEGVLQDPSPSVQLANFTPNYVEIETLLWINTFSEFSNLSLIRSQAMDATQAILLEHGYTLSSEVSTAVEISNQEKLGLSCNPKQKSTS